MILARAPDRFVKPCRTPRRRQDRLACGHGDDLVAQYGLELAFEDDHRLLGRVHVVGDGSPRRQGHVADAQRPRALVAVHDRPALHAWSQVHFLCVILDSLVKSLCRSN